MNGPAANGVVVALRFDAKTCTADERTAVTEAFGLARERVAAGLQVALSNPNDPRLQRWFGSGSRDRVVQVLQAVQRQMNETHNFTIACSTVEYCVQRNPMAFTSHANRIVGFCRGFFRASLTGEDSRFGAVVHELSHLAARTQDHAYNRRNASTLAAKEGHRAADNADSYEYFLETLHE